MRMDLDAMAQAAVRRLAQESNRRAGQRLRRLRERWHAEQALDVRGPCADRAADPRQRSLLPAPSVYVLRISPTIVQHWQARGVTDRLAGLTDQAWRSGRLRVARQALQDVIEDCRVMAAPSAAEVTPGLRHAYRSLLVQCEQVLRIGPVEDDAALVDVGQDAVDARPDLPCGVVS